jgi:autotransporter-associated beta strand protein
LALTANGAIADASALTDNGHFNIAGIAAAGADVKTLLGDGAVTLGAKNLTFTNASTDFGGDISGAGNVTLASGQQTLSGANGFTGHTVIDVGTSLVMDGAGAIAPSAGVTDQGVFDISGTTPPGTDITTLNGDGQVALGGNTLTLTSAADSFAGTISGAGGLQIAAGAETLTGVNVFTGAASITGGATLALTGAGSVADAARVNDDGTLLIGGAGNGGADIVSLGGEGGVSLGANTLTVTEAGGNFGGDISGAGNLHVAGGAQTLSGVNFFTGGTAIDSGATIALAGAGAIAASDGVTDNGVFDISSAAAGGSDITTLNGDGNVTLGSNTLSLTAATGTFSGAMNGIGGGLHVVAGGETLTGGNAMTGGTTIDSGATLALTGIGSIADSAGITNNGVFNIAAAGNGGSSIETLLGGGTVALGANRLTITAGSTDFAGVIAGSGGLTMAGGAQTLSGVNTFTDLTDIQSGATLALNGPGGIADSDEVTVDGVFDISAASNGGSAITTMNGDGNVTLGSNSLTLTAANDEFDGTISGAGNLNVTGGSESLGGANPYTGDTEINAGATISLTGNGAIAAASGVADDGVFAIADATAPGASIATLSGDGIVHVGVNTLTLTAATDEFDGDIEDSGNLEIAGGTQSLGATNLYTGDTNIDSGATLALTGGGAIAQSAQVDDAGVFDISAVTDGALISTLLGGGNVNLGAQTLSLTDASTNFSGDIGGAGGLSISFGAQTLSGANLYSGATTIDDGTSLILAGAGSVADSAGITNDGIFDISAATPPGAAVATIDGDGNVALGANTLTLTNATGTFAGTMDGAGGLEVAAGGETLTGANLYTGATTVENGGALYLANLGSIADSSTVDDEGNFDISAAGNGGSDIISLTGGGAVNLGGDTLTLTDAADDFSGDIGGTGTLAIAAGSETLSGINDLTGGALVDGGATLSLSGAGSMALADDITVNGMFDISAASNGGSAITTLDGDGDVALGANTLSLTAASGNFAGTISGAGALNVAAGSETLSGSNTYTGGSAIAAGATLALSGAGSIGASSGLTDQGVFDISAADDGGASIATLNGGGTVALGANTMTLTAASDDFSGDISGAGGIEIAGGAETLSSVNDYTGATGIDNGGELLLVGDGAIAASNGVADNGVFDISAVNDQTADIETLSGDGTVNLGVKTLVLTGADDTFTGVIQGTGGVTMQDGTETLTNVNTDLGATDIQSGNTLVLSGAGSIADSDQVTVDGVLDISAAGNGGSDITTVNGDGAVMLGANTLTLTDAADNFAGTIAGTGGLTIAGGTETLSGANSFSGPAIIDPGTGLALGAGGNIATASGVADEGTFDISGVTGGTSIARLGGVGLVVLGSNMLTLTAAQDEFSGMIGGAGGLTVAGGTETLYNVNPFTGPAAIAVGATLALAGNGALAAASVVQADGAFDISAAGNGGTDITSLAGIGRVALGANTLGITNAAGTFGGDIGGTGNVAVIAGTQTLSGLNGYTGATGIAAGATLVLTGNASIGSSSVVVDQGLFDVYGENNGGTTIKNLAGDGTVNLGADTLNVVDETALFAGTLTGTGNLNIEGGNLDLAAISNTTPYQGTVNVDDGTSEINQKSANQLSGPLDLNNGGINANTPVTLDQTLSVDGDSSLNGPATTGDSPEGTDSVTLTGSITGDGTLSTTGNVIDDGSGGTTGGAAVQSGTLEIGDSNDPDAVFEGDISVGADGSTLRGHGTVDGSVTSSGDVFPGGSIGKLSITGNYTQSAAGRLTIEVTPSNTAAGVDYDQLEVGGVASLAGTLATQIDPAAGQYIAGDVYAGVLSAGQVTGRFASLAGNEIYPGYLSLQPVYTSNAVNLRVTASPLAYHSGNAILDNEYNEDSQELGAMDAIFDGAPAGPDDGGSMMQARAGSWAGGGGSFGRANGDRLSDYGSLIGQGFAVSPDALIGIAYGHMSTNTQSGQQLVKGSGNGFFGYGVYQPGAWQFAGVVGGGSTSLTSQRNLTPLSFNAGGGQNEGMLEGALQARYLAQLGQGYIMPFGRVGYIKTSRGAFAESGAGNLDIAYGAHDGSLTALTGGIRAGLDDDMPRYLLSPWVEISGTGFTGNRKISDIETIGLAPDTQNSTAAPGALLNFGAGVTFSEGAWSGSLSYQGQAAGGAQQNAFAASVTYRW